MHGDKAHASPPGILGGPSLQRGNSHVGTVKAREVNLAEAEAAQSGIASTRARHTDDICSLQKTRS